MENIISAMLLNPVEERTITIKSKPEKKEAPPEQPMDPSSANLPQAVLDMLGMGAGDAPAASPMGLPPELLQMLMAGQMQQAADPLGGQMPMSGFNPYGG